METLDTNQGGPGRHKCCYCSFQDGLNSIYSKEELLKLSEESPKQFYKCPHNKVAPVSILVDLQESQGGVVRHRCATCAYWRALSSLSPTGNASPFSLFLTNPNFIGKNRVPKDNIRREGIFVNSDRNIRLGHLGELATISYEKSLLFGAGRNTLAENVEHVSMTKGDAIGYDIRSYNVDGTDKWIEVKTTTGSSNSLFHISENQLSVAELNPKKFHLYRIYDFDTELRTGSLYTLNGQLRDQLALSASSYKALPK